MLYDPRWGKKVEAKPSLAGFVAWLEIQNPRQRYNWGDGRNCAIGQYLRQQFGFKDANKRPHHEYEELEGGYAFVALTEPHTFGAALKRARAVLAASK